MKSFRVSLAKWANWCDMQLPFYTQPVEWYQEAQASFDEEFGLYLKSIV